MLFGLIFTLGLLLAWQQGGWAGGPPAEPVFSGERVYQDVLTQMEFGPRTPGSPAQTEALNWFQDELQQAGWAAEIQEAEFDGQTVRNLVAIRGTGVPWYILGAHYDSRLVADRDPDPSLQSQPVPGANDGASGVALLLELARVLPPDWPGSLWIVLFDAEDQGGIEGWDWIYGSRAFVESLDGRPEAVIIVDMIGDADLSIPMEGNSDEQLRSALWSLAAELGYGDIFIPEVKYHIVDDHLPFLEAGIPAVDIIDLDYEFWHTTQDTADKVSPASLQVVGDVVLEWLLRLGQP